MIACEYGAPWKGAGAASVRTTSLSIATPFRGRAGRRAPCDAQRLEHRLEDVLRVVARDQADVERDPGALGEAAEEAA